MIKRFLIVLIALLSLQTAYSKSSWTITDTIPEKSVMVPESKLKNLLTAAELGRNAQQKVNVLNSQIATLTERINALNSIVITQEGKEANYKQLIENKDNEIRIMQETRVILTKQRDDIQKKLDRSRRGKKWIAFGGIASTIAAFVLGAALH